jgi:hypothetical protein
MSHTPVPGSTRSAPTGSFRLDEADPSASVTATLIVRRAEDGIADAHPDDTDAVLAFATEYGLDAIAVHREARAITLGGSVAAMNAAFKVSLDLYALEGNVYRCRTGDAGPRTSQGVR